MTSFFGKVSRYHFISVLAPGQFHNEVFIKKNTFCILYIIALSYCGVYIIS